MFKCKFKEEKCDFALSNGECSQPTISLELCFKKEKITGLSLNKLKILYNKFYAHAGDTEEDFYKWAIDYLLNLLNRAILILERHTKGIEKEIECLKTGR